MRALQLPASTVLAFVLASGFTADFTSLPLPISNLVNILSADAFHLGFIDYAVVMIPVDALATAASAGVLWLVFRKAIPLDVEGGCPHQPVAAINDRRLFAACWLVLLALAAGYLLSQWWRLPVSLLAGSAVLLLLALVTASPEVELGSIITAAPWDVMLFSVGMYVVVFSLRDTGLMSTLESIFLAAFRLGNGVGIVVTGLVAALMSAVVNNLPAVMVNTLAIQGSSLPPAHQLGAALANVVGSDIGPKLTPLGSLSTLLWLHVLRRRGMEIGWRSYLKPALLVTIPVLVITLLGLALSWQLVGYSWLSMAN